MTSVSRGIASAACVAALAVAAAGCGSAGPARPASAAVTVPPVPLDTSVATTAGTWATVVMGGSPAQYDNFWQLFLRPAGSTQWRLVTPPGTADNGGLVLAEGTDQALITAFRPSQRLTYTPLTKTSDGGYAWSALDPLDAPLASTPGSLAVQPQAGRLLALLSSGTAEQGTPGGTSWTALTTARALGATAAGRSCGLRALTAVGYTPAGAALLAGACSRPGIAGIFATTGHTWQAAGPALPGALAQQPVTVLRLSTVGNQTTALLAAGTGQHAALVAAWTVGGGTGWAVSPPLSTGGQAVAAVSFGPGQAVAAIMAGGRGAILAGDRWEFLPGLPTGTMALAPGTGGAASALAVHGATLTVWQLTGSDASWTRVQTITVPIEYGSSS